MFAFILIVKNTIPKVILDLLKLFFIKLKVVNSCV